MRHSSSPVVPTSAPGIKPTLACDGQTIAVKAGAVVVAVQRVNARAFRLSIRYGSTGAECDRLSRSFPAERSARHAARVAVRLFRSGQSMQQVSDLADLFASTSG